MPDGTTKVPAALAMAGEGALTLIGASLNKLVFLGDLAEPSTSYSGGVRLRRYSVVGARCGEGPFTIRFAGLRHRAVQSVGSRNPCQDGGCIRTRKVRSTR